MKRVFCSLIIVFLIMLMTTAFANDGVVGVTPEGVYPITQADIMMKSEEIYIDCALGKVTCRFDFKNLGDAQKVTMGFPAKLNGIYESLTTEEDITVRDFTAKDKNGEIPVTLADTIPNPPLNETNSMEEYAKWYIFNVDFAENEEKTLFHTYNVNFSHTSDGCVYLGYVIETGALWKGPIGHSKVIFDFKDIPMYTITEIKPNNFFRIDGSKLIFERSSFKPSYNLWVTYNQFRYTNEEYFDIYYSGNETKEMANEKIELFKTPIQTIRKNSKKYFKLYQELISKDSVSALYIKSALDLPNGNEKPKITECTITEHLGNTWRIEFYGQDPDGDIVSYQPEINGTEKFRFFNDGIYYDQEQMRFTGRGYFEVQEDFQQSKPLSITFNLYDSAGNSDSETILLQADPSAPLKEEPVAATPEVTPETKPAADNSDNELADIPASEEVNKGVKMLPTEAETIPLLISGVMLVLLVSLAVIVVLLIKTKRKGYLIFIGQIIFLVLGLWQTVQLLSARDFTDGIMSSEYVSLKIGIIAICWALSMLCMLGGIVLTCKVKKSK